VNLNISQVTGNELYRMPPKFFFTFLLFYFFTFWRGTVRISFRCNHIMQRMAAWVQDTRLTMTVQTFNKSHQRIRNLPGCTVIPLYQIVRVLFRLVIGPSKLVAMQDESTWTQVLHSKSKQYIRLNFHTACQFSRLEQRFRLLITRPRADERGKSELVAVTSWEPLIGSSALCQALHLPSSPTPPR
jgi:hypothetical protein